MRTNLALSNISYNRARAALSVAGIGDFAGSAEICPGLTTIRIPANRIGQMAADTLVAMSSDNRSLPFVNQTVTTQLVIRGSTSARQ